MGGEAEGAAAADDREAKDGGGEQEEERGTQGEDEGAGKDGRTTQEQNGNEYEVVIKGESGDRKVKL